MQLLYESDLTGKPVQELLPGFLERTAAGEDVKEFVSRLAAGQSAHREDIDRLLAQAADNWELDRIAAVDRAILRLAASELISMNDIPPAVTINEAVEIAKRYSTLESAKFVNGILDRVKELAGR